MNVGIIGFGKMGRLRFSKIRKGGKGRVVGITEPGECVFLPEGVAAHPHAEALIADPAIEAVFICTPNHLNRPLTLQALRAGKHVFCEKPPALNAGEMEEIIRAEEQSGKKLMYGFNHRHHESMRRMKKLVESGEYGRVMWMRGRYGKSVDKNFYTDWRAKKESAGGGILIDQGIHMLDLFLMLADDFDEVQAHVSNLYWNLEVEDNVFAILSNRNGVVASLHSTMTQWRHLFSLEVFLEKGYIVLNGLLTPSGTYGEEVMTIARNRTTAPAATWSDEEHIRFNVDRSWARETDHFFEVIEKGLAVEAGSSGQALKLMRLVDKIYQCGSKGGNRESDKRAAMAR